MTTADTQEAFLAIDAQVQELHDKIEQNDKDQKGSRARLQVLAEEQREYDDAQAVVAAEKLAAAEEKWIADFAKAQEEQDSFRQAFNEGKAEYQTQKADFEAMSPGADKDAAEVLLN
jgi:hypothetical protein